MRLVIYKTYKFNLGIFSKKKKKKNLQETIVFEFKKGKFFDTSKKIKKNILIYFKGCKIYFILFFVRNVFNLKPYDIINNLSFSLNNL